MARVYVRGHYAQYYAPKSSILLAGTGVWKIISVACEHAQKHAKELSDDGTYRTGIC